MIGPVKSFRIEVMDIESPVSITIRSSPGTND